LKKGRKVLIEGRLVPDLSTGGPRIYNRQDGSSGASFEVNASTVRFLSSKSEGEGGGYQQFDEPTAQSADSDLDSSIPF
jgi:single-strand DNA-binding protein